MAYSAGMVTEGGFGLMVTSMIWARHGLGDGGSRPHAGGSDTRPYHIEPAEGAYHAMLAGK